MRYFGKETLLEVKKRSNNEQKGLILHRNVNFQEEKWVKYQVFSDNNKKNGPKITT